VIIGPFIFIVIPLKYIKYIGLFPLMVVTSWVIFDGCILNSLHDDTLNSIVATKIILFLNLFSTNLAHYVNKKYIINTNRGIYLTFLYQILLTTILLYRVIFNIDILK